MRIRTKLVGMNVVLLVVTITAITTLCLREFSQELRRQAILSQESRMKTFRDLLTRKGSGFQIVGGNLMVGNYVINGNYELPDRLKELCGGTATIFMGDLRISTNITKEDGSRAVGTRLQGEAHDAVINQGVPYRGEADVLGVPYFTAYDPIKDARGATIGALYVGVKQSEFLAQYDRLRLLIIGLALALVVAAVFVNRGFIHRLFVPLNRMHDVLINAQESGDLTQRLDYLKKDEVGEMCHAFNDFIDKLNGILATISQSAEKLTASGGDPVGHLRDDGFQFGSHRLPDGHRGRGERGDGRHLQRRGPELRPGGGRFPPGQRIGADRFLRGPGDHRGDELYLRAGQGIGADR